MEVINKKSIIPYVFMVFEIMWVPLKGYFSFPRPDIIHTFIDTAFFLFMLSQDETFRRIVMYRLNAVWGVLIVYHMINCILHEVPLMHATDTYFYYWEMVFTCYCTLVTTCYLFLQDSERTLKFLLIGFSIYMVLGFQIVSVDADFEDRLRSAKLHPNQFAQAAGMMLMIVAYCRNTGVIRTKFIWGLLTALPLYAIIGCGSRNGFLLFVIYLIALLLSSFFKEKVSFKKVFSIIVLCLIGFYVVGYLLDNTMLGERILSTEEQAETQQLGTGTILDNLGDRGIFYLIGWENFIENPLFGIGMWNFQFYNNWPVALHSEYMIHITEGGIIGAFLYFYFIVSVFVYLIKRFNLNRGSETVLLLVAFTSYLFVGLTAREFYYSQFYPIIGLCIATKIKDTYEQEGFIA